MVTFFNAYMIVCVAAAPLALVFLAAYFGARALDGWRFQRMLDRQSAERRRRAREAVEAEFGPLKRR